MSTEILEIAVEQALDRIKKAYAQTGGKMYLSFSGGKDSTVLAHLIMMAELPENIPFIFANTGIELDATLNFVKNFDYDNIVIVKPRKPFSQILKQHGKPAISKIKSDWLNTHQKHIDTPLKTVRQRQMILGIREKDGVVIGKTGTRLANKHMHFVHPDTEIKFANKCCQYMKKYPFQDYVKENNLNGAFTGIRTAEGGIRSTVYKSCTSIKKVGKKEFLTSMPIYDWSDELIEQFIKKYDIELSDAYEKYGCKRTGCVGCPFAKDLKGELKMLYENEPLKYKAIMHWMKDVYIYQLIECDWDNEYMKDYKTMKPIIEQRREEMMSKFRNQN